MSAPRGSEVGQWRLLRTWWNRWSGVMLLVWGAALVAVSVFGDERRVNHWLLAAGLFWIGPGAWTIGAAVRARRRAAERRDAVQTTTEPVTTGPITPGDRAPARR